MIKLSDEAVRQWLTWHINNESNSFLKITNTRARCLFINLAIFGSFDCCFKHSHVEYNLRKITVICFSEIDRKIKRLINGKAGAH